MLWVELWGALYLWSGLPSFYPCRLEATRPHTMSLLSFQGSLSWPVSVLRLTSVIPPAFACRVRGVARRTTKLAPFLSPFAVETNRSFTFFSRTKILGFDSGPLRHELCWARPWVCLKMVWTDKMGNHNLLALQGNHHSRVS